MASTVTHKATDEYKQSSIIEHEAEHRVMDIMIEYFIHNDLKSSVAESLRHYPQGKLCQLRRCTLKSMVIHYVRTVISMDEKSKLVAALSTLEKLFAEQAVNDKKTLDAFEALQRKLRYEIVIHHLESCGAPSARQMIANYWPPRSMGRKDKLIVNKLQSFCTHFENDVYRKDKASTPTSWNAFKKWSRIPLKRMLESCGTPILERVAMASKHRQNET